MNGSLVNFYNNLFAIEIAVYGIITAVVFVFVQLIYSKYAPPNIKSLFKDISLIGYFIISIFVSVFTATASFLLSLGEHDIFPFLHLYSVQIFTWQYTGILCLVATFLSICCFIIFIYKNFSYLRPGRILLLLTGKIDFSKIRNFLLKRYGVPSPKEDFEELKMRIKTLSDADEESQKDSKSTEEYEKLKRQQKTDLENYRELKNKVKDANDPLIPIRDMAVKLIRECDLKTLKEVCETYNEITNSFFSNLKTSQDKKDWDPNKDLASNYCYYLLEHITFLIEICDKENLDCAKLFLIKASKDFADILIETGHHELLSPLSSFWKKVADESISGSPKTFKEIIFYYREILGRLIEEYEEEREGGQEDRLRNDLFKDLGRIGERLLSKKGFEEKPLMRDYEYTTDYDELLETLLSLRDDYNRKRPSWYPLLFFDAVEAVLRKVIELYEENRDEIRLEEDIYSFCEVFYSFAEEAMKVGNSRGAALAFIRLRMMYELLHERNLSPRAYELVNLLVGLGLLAAAHNEELEPVDLSNDKPMKEWIIDKLLKLDLPEGKVKSSINQRYPRFHGEEHEAAWEFITELGNKLETNFDFRFDWKTGELYAEDDPHRH